MVKKLNFDFKKFLLEKGERVGVAIAASFAVLLILVGVMAGLKVISPLDPLKANANDLTNRVSSHNPTKDDIAKEPALKPPQWVRGRDPNATAVEEWVTPVNTEDTKKRNPQVLGLMNYRVDVLRVPVRVIDFDKNVRVYNLGSLANGSTDMHPAEKVQPTRMVIVNASFPYKSELEAFRRALRLKPKDELPAAPSFRGFYVYRRVTLPNGQVKKFPTDKDPNYEWQTLDLESEKSPFRLLISSSPKIEPVDENQKPVAFTGLVMPTPTLRLVDYPLVKLKGIPDPKEPDASDDEEKDKDQEKGKGDEQPMKPPVAPKGSGSGKGPMKNPMGINNAGGAQKVVSVPWKKVPEALQDQLLGKTFDPFDASGRRPEGDAEKNPTTVKKGQENCLFRFIDVEVLPGHSYEYTIVIRLANPNFKKKKQVADEMDAEIEELTSGYNYIPKVTVPYDVQWYAVDQRALDPIHYAAAKNRMTGADKEAPMPPNTKVAVQVHRWVDRVPNPNRPRDTTGLGAWLVAERLLLQRGEYIGREVGVDAPEWVQGEEQFRLPATAVKAAGQKPKFLPSPVDFTVKPDRDLPPALLVDFNGGYQSNLVGKRTVIEEAGAEMLVLTPDGKLEVHNSVDDTDPENPNGSPEARARAQERLERYQACKRWINKLRGEGPAGKKAPKERGVLD